MAQVCPGPAGAACGAGARAAGGGGRGPAPCSGERDGAEGAEPGTSRAWN